MKLLDSLPELLKIHWLLDIAVHAPVIAADQILFFQGRSEDNHRDHLRAGVALDRAEHFQSVHFGQLQIQEDQFKCVLGDAVAIGSTAEKKIQGLLTVARHVNPIGYVVLAHHMQGQLQVRRIIFH